MNDDSPNSEIAKYLGLPAKTDVLQYVSNLAGELKNYKNLAINGLSVFGRSGMDELMDTAVQHLWNQYMPASTVFIWKTSPNSTNITVCPYLESTRVYMGLSCEKMAVLEPFLLESPVPVLFSELAEKTGIDSILASTAGNEGDGILPELQPEIVVPVISPRVLYGLILVGHKSTKKDYTETELEFMQKYLIFVSQSMKTRLYYEHSLYDVKTGLYNHDYFIARVQEEIAKTKRAANAVSSVIVIDVDKFKDFNDNYGHLAGDEVLKSLVQVIKQNIRSVDIPSRFGGEEFTVLLPNSNADAAMVVAERLRTKTAGMKVVWEVPLSQVTISLGIFSFDKDSDVDTNGIIRHADEAMYASKISGRNRVSVWNPSMKIEPEEKGKAGNGSKGDAAKGSK